MSTTDIEEAVRKLEESVKALERIKVFDRDIHNVRWEIEHSLIPALKRKIDQSKGILGVK